MWCRAKKTTENMTQQINQPPPKIPPLTMGLVFIHFLRCSRSSSMWTTISTTITTTTTTWTSTPSTRVMLWPTSTQTMQIRWKFILLFQNPPFPPQLLKKNRRTSCSHNTRWTSCHLAGGEKGQSVKLLRSPSSPFWRSQHEKQFARRDTKYSAR